MTSARILVTGGYGFVGRNLVERLSEDYVVDVIDDKSSCFDGNRKAVEKIVSSVGGACYEVGITSPEVREIVRACNPKAVCHLAAVTGVLPSLEDPVGDCMSNVVGTLNLLEGCRSSDSTPLVIAASSSAPLGDALPPHNEETKAAPISPYGASKLAMESYLSVYAQCFDIPAIALRFANLYGRHCQTKMSIVPRQVRDGIAEGFVAQEGDGSTVRDMLHVSDLAKLFAILIEDSKAPSGAYHVSSGVLYSVSEITAIVRQSLMSHGYSTDLHHAPARAVDIKRSEPDSSKIRGLTGWSPDVSLERGVSDTVEWMIENFV